MNDWSLRALAALTVWVTVACGSADALDAAQSAQSAPSASESAERADALDESRTTAIVRAADRVAPAVVSINVIRTQRVQARSAWESFFLPPNAQRRSAGFGSGVIVRPEGIVLTNDHVIRDASQIQVSLSDGRDFEAELVGTDPVSDIAVLRIEGRDLPVAPIGTVSGLMIGEWAIAPSGAADVEPTVTAGVVSAVNRNITPSSDGQGFYFGMIQTDASINPGNSGGPLVNAVGEIIGINASIISRSGGSEGLGFAIPIDRAMRIADDLVRFGEIRRAWVGIDVEPVEADAWGRTRGVRISRVARGSPADRPRGGRSAPPGQRPGARRTARLRGDDHGSPRGRPVGALRGGSAPDHRPGSGGLPVRHGGAGTGPERHRIDHRNPADPGRAQPHQRGRRAHRRHLERAAEPARGPAP